MVLILGAGNLASVYYDQGLLDYAILHYKQALLLDSSFIEAYNNLVRFDNLIPHFRIGSFFFDGLKVVLYFQSVGLVHGQGGGGFHFDVGDA